MKCPFCSRTQDRVVDSREGKAGAVIRRRRECLACNKRFTSYERIEDIPFMVIKRDGSREVFERAKLMSGLVKAVEKRSVGMEVLDDIVNSVEALMHEAPSREIETARIGEQVMNRLREIDQVAYVRFASVYRRFEDVNQFMLELKGLLEKEKSGPEDR
ncbi:MAG: transcriptional regulator NrdR [Acidobacteriota bacterium]